MGTKPCDLLHLQHLRVLVRPDLFPLVTLCEVGMEISGLERHRERVLDAQSSAKTLQGVPS